MSRKFQHKKFKGRDISKLVHPSEYEGIPVVKGRVVQIDGDFLAYMTSYDPSKKLSEMQHNTDAMIERLRSQSGSESVCIHLTADDSDKGNRYNIAMQREYQGNRKDKEKPKHLDVMRKWLEKERGAIMHHDLEADDGMSMNQYADMENSCIATKDKDLRMVPGLQIDWTTGALNDSDEWGFISIKEKVQKNKQVTKKLIGRGWKFFWAQLLMGDTADNIKGLPWCIHDITEGKAKRIGPAYAYAIMQPMKNNREAWTTVQKLFKRAGEHEAFKDYRDESVISWKAALLSEMKLLWMRRTNDENDVMTWLKETLGAESGA